MKNRTTIRAGELPYLRDWLTSRSWILQEPKGKYEVLRAVNGSYPRPLMIHAREGCLLEPMAGLSIDERDKKIYNAFRRMMDERYRTEGYTEVLYARKDEI